ncbi:DUF5455 family protein [Gallaecimonas pentaromativorans]|uniref:DUF5455 family protein n=1 Tax=Gallaecimonas pentaromativorans TaxID=584787 RepID=UPI0011CDCCD8|nr:DUF5455 family protein [Gallaecimonas pentaromativorans]
MLALFTKLGGLLTAFFTLFAQFIARKGVLSVLYIGVYIAITGTFIAGVNGIILSLNRSFPGNVYFQAGIQLVPSNAGQCIGAIAAAHLLLITYNFKQVLLKLKILS